MNVVNLMGRLVRDPEVRTAQSGTKVANYTLAVDRYKGDADFIRCVVFGKGAEFAEKFLAKGKKIAVTGSIHTDTYTTKECEKRSTFEVIANSQEFAESKKAETPEDYPDDFVNAEIPEDVPFV